MTQRRAFQCPNHQGSPYASAVGELTREHRNPLRCDFVVLGWRSTPVGTNKKGETIYEHVPDTVPGCGGSLLLCVHGQRVCESCPPQFVPTDDPVARTESLAQILECEAEGAAQRERMAREAKRKQEPTASASFKIPQGKVQLPFLGDEEPKRYQPPRGKTKKT